MTDLKTTAAYDAQVDSYLGMIDQQAIDPQLLDFIERLKSGDFVLDLGCGPAKASAIMRDHGLRVDPVDASLEMIKRANDRFNIGARQAIFEDIKSKATYDGIWANFSLLHATAKDLPNILQALHQALKPEGLFHLGMKTGSGSARDNLNRYYSYYSLEELTTHLADAGFVVEHTESGEAKGLAGDVEPWVVLTSRSQN